MPTVFDTTHDCSKALGCFKAAGYDTLMRYYARDGLDGSGSACARRRRSPTPA